MRWTRALAAGLLSSTVLVAPLVGTAPAAADPTGTGGRAVVGSSACTANPLPRNDDGSSHQVTLPFGVDFYGETFTSAWVNNNGNITFDGALSTFTPFGLTGTQAKIIAPFFADVDTRAVGSDLVAYGWGESVYEGHRAFCVNWVNVGYYSHGTDKLNSFQLLLVEREDSDPGDFDIVFNYDQVQWESGSASGGSGGLGGYSARAGFSNGTGQQGTFHEFAGSGVNGAFLDTSPTGLARTSTDSSVPGRHVFRVRAGAAPTTEYVALGDSFQSGEGSFSYWPGTDTDSNRCHRSLTAYPERLVDRGSVRLNLQFWACSGAVAGDLDDTAVRSDDIPWDDPERGTYLETTPSGTGADKSYLDRLDASTRLVTIGIGGNDMGFAAVLADCIKDTLGDAYLPFHDSSCEEEYGDAVDAKLRELVADDLWTDVFDDVRQRAPFARVLVLGYPRFYVAGGASNGLSDDHCAGARLVDQRWMNREIGEVNAEIRDAALSRGMQYVDIYDTPQGHELCSGSSTPFLNGIHLRFGNPPTKPESYHPTSFGHSLIADEIEDVLDDLPQSAVRTTVMPEQTYTFPFSVVPGPDLFFSTTWPGSDVVMTLVTPSGRRIGRDTAAPDVQHRVGPTYEHYGITDPEPGEWTVELFGARVAAQGEPTDLVAYQPPARNALPVAVVDLVQRGRTVTVSAERSTDADGRVVEHLWEFGDGTTATGPTATHTYTDAETFLVTLAVKDDDGGEGFASSDGTITVPRYEFSGFSAPVEPEPAVNRQKAGSTVPLKFSLGGDHGLQVLESGAPSVQQTDCTTGAALGSPTRAAAADGGGLTYDPSSDRYQYDWKTERGFAGSCRTLVLTLDDGSTHTALFRFER